MRNTICAALTTITLALCTALAGCGGMSCDWDHVSGADKEPDR